MADINTIKERIVETIRPNGKGAITAADHQELLLEIADSVAYKDGKHPRLTAGFANNLVGRGEAIESTIGFRASGGKSIEDGAARVKELRGNSVVWNQLASPLSNVSKYYPTNAKNLVYEDGVLSCEVSSLDSSETYLDSYVVCHANHKYMASLDVYSYTTGSGLYLYVGEKLNAFAKLVSKANAWEQCLIFFECPSYNAMSRFRPYLGAKSKITELGVVKFRNAQFVDLTQMFGAGNEPTTIEDFYARIPQNVDLYAYNEGELLSCNADGIKSVGFNAWDEEWEVGGLSQDGSLYNTSNSIRSKNYNRVLEGVEYCIKANENAVFACIYDKDFRFLDSWSVSANMIRVFTMNQGAYWFKIGLPNNTTSVYTGGICINLSHTGYRNGEYQPYMQFIRNLDNRIKEAFPNGLRSADNAHDVVYNKNGKGYIEQRVGSIDMGNLEWVYDSASLQFYSEIVPQLRNENAMNIDVICGRYLIDYRGSELLPSAHCRGYYAQRIYIVDPSYSDAVSLKKSLKGVGLNFPLVEPITIEYDEPFNLDYEVWDFGTEEMLTSEPSAPIRGMIAYGFNAVDEIRELRQMLATMQAQLANL